MAGAIGASREQVATTAETLGYALVGYGKSLHDKGDPIYKYTHAILAVQTEHPHLKQGLGGAWALRDQWETEEPPVSHVVMPVPLIQSTICVALLWNEHEFAALFGLGVAGMLRPSELLLPFRRDLILPSDRGDPGGDLILRIVNPKTRRYARRQHARVTDRAIIGLCEVAFAGLPPGNRLTRFSSSAFRRVFDAILGHLRVPTGRKSGGPTPASMRGSGATAFYLDTEDVQRTAWRGRWRTLSTIERYLQDAAGTLLLHDLSPEAKALVRIFADASGTIVASFLKDPCLWSLTVG